MRAEDRLIKFIHCNIRKHKIKVNGQDIAYITTGIGDPLILIHGINIGWGQWYPNIESLANYFSVFAIDLPGAGRSSKIDFSKSDLEKSFIETLEKFSQKLKLTKINIIGHSIGAWVGLNLMIRKTVEVKSSILVDPVGFTEYIPWKQRPLASSLITRFLAKLVMRPTRENIRIFLRSVFYNPACLQDFFIDYVYEGVNRGKVTHPFLLMNRIVGIFKINKQFVLTDKLSKISTPTLVIMGDRDPLLPLGKTLQAIKNMSNFKVKIISNTGHVPTMEEPDKFNKIAASFLLGK